MLLTQPLNFSSLRLLALNRHFNFQMFVIDTVRQTQIELIQIILKMFVFFF